MEFFEYLRVKKYVELVLMSGDIIMPRLTVLGQDIHGIAGLFEFLRQRYSFGWSDMAKIIAIILSLGTSIFVMLRSLAEGVAKIISSL